MKKQPYQSYSPNAQKRGAFQHQQHPSDYSMQRGDTPDAQKRELHSPIRTEVMANNNRRNQNLSATPTQRQEYAPAQQHEQTPTYQHNPFSTVQPGEFEQNQNDF